MKILHTADWHLGKKLHKTDLSAEYTLFLDWLYCFIEKEKIDVLLIAGDIFDVAHPPQDALMLYYDFLAKMVTLQCHIIVTGGNHDSPSVLNAPHDLLKRLYITVIGCATEYMEDELVLIKKNGEELLVAAVPYLRNNDLRQFREGENQAERQGAVREGISKHYAALATLAHEKYPGVLAIAMGHLYAHGVSSSDSEREIQIGNLAGISANHFPESFAYIALGHIHRPQKVGDTQHIRYSGSPIALSFSERSDQKIIIVLETTPHELKAITTVEVPIFRRLYRIAGTFEQVQTKLSVFRGSSELPDFLEILVEEPHHNPLLIKQLQEIIDVLEESDSKIKVLKYSIMFENQALGLEQLFDANEHIEDLAETEVLQRQMATKNIAAIEQSLVMEAFRELLEMVKQ